MSSQSSSSSSHVVKLSDIIEKAGCLLADADAVLERLERRYRRSDVEKFSAFVHELQCAVEVLENETPGSYELDLPVIDDLASVSESENSPLGEEEDDEC